MGIWVFKHPPQRRSALTSLQLVVVLSSYMARERLRNDSAACGQKVSGAVL